MARLQLISLFALAACARGPTSESLGPARSQVPSPEVATVEIDPPVRTHEPPRADREVQRKRVRREPPPTSAAELIERGIAAIRVGDADAYVDLTITNDAVRKQCPDFSDRFDDDADEGERLGDYVRNAFEQCAEIDWTRATEVERVAGRPGEPVSHCGITWAELGDVLVSFDTPGGEVTVKLDDPMQVGALFVFGGNPRCRSER